MRPWANTHRTLVQWEVRWWSCTYVLWEGGVAGCEQMHAPGDDAGPADLMAGAKAAACLMSSKTPGRSPAGRCWPGQVSTNALGEIRRIVRRLGTDVDVAALLEVRKGQARIKPAVLVHVGRGIPT